MISAYFYADKLLPNGDSSNNWSGFSHVVVWGAGCQLMLPERRGWRCKLWNLRSHINKHPHTRPPYTHSLYLITLWPWPFDIRISECWAPAVEYMYTDFSNDCSNRFSFGAHTDATDCSTHTSATTNVGYKIRFCHKCACFCVDLIKNLHILYSVLHIVYMIMLYAVIHGHGQHVCHLHWIFFINSDIVLHTDSLCTMFAVIQQVTTPWLKLFDDFPE